MKILDADIFAELNEMPEDAERRPEPEHFHSQLEIRWGKNDDDLADVVGRYADSRHP